MLVLEAEGITVEMAKCFTIKVI